MSVSFRRASLAAAAAVVLTTTVAGVVMAGSAGSVAATGDPASRTVTVSGLGQASGTPDVVRLDLGVQRTGDNVNAALDAANADIRKIKEALARHGVKDADIQTSQLSINQHYGPVQPYEGSYGGSYEGKAAPPPSLVAPMIQPAPAPGAPVASDAAVAPDEPTLTNDPMPAADLPLKEDPAVLGTREGMSSVPPMASSYMPVPDGPNGFDVFQSLSVKLRSLDDAGATISDAAEAGGDATRINGVSFEFEDSEGLMKDAREDAFADAKSKAEQYARLAGGSLGRVVSISEGNAGGDYAYAVAARDAAAGSSVPLFAGSQQVSVNSTVVFELS